MTWIHSFNFLFFLHNLPFCLSQSYEPFQVLQLLYWIDTNANVESTNDPNTFLSFNFKYRRLKALIFLNIISS